MRTYSALSPACCTYSSVEKPAPQPKIGTSTSYSAIWRVKSTASSVKAHTMTMSAPEALTLFTTPDRSPEPLVKGSARTTSMPSSGNTLVLWLLYMLVP